MSRYDLIIFENNRLEHIGYYGTVAFNETAKAFFKIVARNEDGTVWGKRLGRLVVLKRNADCTYGPERTVRYHWKELS